MSRPLRIQFPNAWYHVMNRGRRGEEIFLGKGDYLTFINLLTKVVEMFNVKIAAYCLMPNHYHLLVQTPDANLSRGMRHLNGIYTQRFNRIHNHDGQLFRGRYKAILIDQNSYLLELIRYIHRNPLEAGLEKTLGQYPWSSHLAYLSDSKQLNWIYKDFVLSLFSKTKGRSITQYKHFVSKQSPEEISKIFESKKLPAMLGDDHFIDWVKEKFFDDKYHPEIPESKSLTPSTDKIRDAICTFYDVDKGELLVSKRSIANEPRNMGIYLTRILRGDSLETIGKEFNMKNYSSVSSVIIRTENQLANDPNLRKRLEKLKLHCN